LIGDPTITGKRGNKLLEVKKRALEKRLKELDYLFSIWEDFHYTKKFLDR